MEDWIEQYENYLRIGRNVSPHTLRNYLSDLRQFEEFLDQRAKEMQRRKSRLRM